MTIPIFEIHIGFSVFIIILLQAKLLVPAGLTGFREEEEDDDFDLFHHSFFITWT